MDELFDAVAEADANEGGNYLKDGDFTLMIEACVRKTGNDGLMSIIEFHVLDSASNGAVDLVPGGAPVPVAPNPKGATASWTQKLVKHKSAKGNVRAFFQHLVGKTQAEIPADQMRNLLVAAYDAKNPFRGMLIRASSFRGMIQSGAHAGKPITKFKWITVPGQTKETIGKGRAYLDARAAAAGAPAPAAAAPVPSVPAPAPVAPPPPPAPPAPAPPAPADPLAAFL